MAQIVPKITVPKDWTAREESIVKALFELALRMSIADLTLGAVMSYAETIAESVGRAGINVTSSRPVPSTLKQTADLSAATQAAADLVTARFPEVRIDLPIS